MTDATALPVLRATAPRTGELVRLRSNRVPVADTPGPSLPRRIGRWIVKAVRFVRRIGRRLRERVV